MMDWLTEGELSFQYPWVLIALVLVPMLLVWFLVQQRQYWRDAFDFSQVSVLRQLKHQRHSVWLQRLLPLLLLLALTSGIVGLAHPQVTTKVATQKRFLMLVLDISISMEANDFKPNRLEAAKAAAINFVKTLPKDIQIGLEYFAGNSYLVSPPTNDHKQVMAYLRSLELSDLRPGTAMGDAIIVAIDTLHTHITEAQEEMPPPSEALPEKPHDDGTVILITDGESNLGVSPLIAVEQAQTHGIQVFTVGIGEATGAYVRGGIFTHLDEGTLDYVAQQTGGQYYRARNMSDFENIYKKITQKTLRYEEHTFSLMGIFLGLSSLFNLVAFWWCTAYRRF